ncbi:MAG: SAM-dependent DNA methyltransferase, partial [Flavobacteriales bacterium]|nr:SAM-dependent DNA methyltransferase [Flavobacteriales bacterium]
MKVAYQVKGPDILPALEKWKKVSDLTVVCCIPAYVDFYINKGYKTITANDYFSLSEDKMHFTHTLANPPFSDRSSNSNNTTDLDSKFNEKSRSISENVSMVIRTKHFTNPKSKFRKKLFSSGTVVEIKYLPKDTFPTILNTETCVLVTSKN